MANDKVFGSDIRRTLNKLNNNLYELLMVNPVTPLPINNTKQLTCGFVPKTDKYFIPKRKFRLKVNTVRDIRNTLEKYVYSTLSTDIEKQQNILLRKIRGGLSKDEKTKLLARNIIKGEKPISRMAWQMIININPDDCPYSSQFVLWNGHYIQVNGSRGGKSKFIYKHDLSKYRESLLRKNEFKKTHLNTTKNMLKQSLYVKFKPGPLSKKNQLDLSYQKYNVGNIELAQIPKPGLDIQPEYGKPIDTSVVNFLHNLRDINGIISEKWAEFAVSALGNYNKEHVVQLNKDCCVTFDLSYKYNQRQLLMRYDVDELRNKRTEKEKISTTYQEDEDATFENVKKMLDDVLLSVEINLIQNTLYTGEEPPREPDTLDQIGRLKSHPKDKFKRRGQSELSRLDVTVIRLFDNEKEKKMDACFKSFCKLGCVCESLLSSFHFKNHCGRVDCMFECKCNYNKYNLRNYVENDIIPGLVSLDEEKSSKLAKEEKKFHQTVILSGEKSILLKSQKRNWKAPQKYADFYSNMCLKTKKDIKRILSIVDIKLNCENIEPWCMIHNLYKCFCKGKFTEKLSDVSNDGGMTINNECTVAKLPSPNREESLDTNTGDTNIKTILRPRLKRAVNIDFNIDKNDLILDHSYQGCARVKAYKSRKYSDIFYSTTNKKITELEQNDHGLRKRMMEILKIDEDSVVKKPKKDSTNFFDVDLPPSTASCQINKEIDETNGETEKKSPHSGTPHKLTSDVITTQFTSSTEQHLNMKLKAWLEPSLKMYRQRFGKGFFKKHLDPPKAGKIALYPWDFVITRYHEKKNLFLVTNQRPFRIFMAVDTKDSLFKNCININSINDLDNYPISVKNIITNGGDRLKDQLCILRGLSICWELVGSIKKVCDRRNSDTENNLNESSDAEAQSQQSYTNLNTPAATISDTLLPICAEQENAEQSKWFIMTIENDFSEIQFYKRGFFVKYDSIVKAINVARVSEKTVRLSSQKRNDGSSDPQFGIYAIPNSNKYSVFIGPYEKNEPLGIETVRNAACNRKLKTRGVWITTNKVDNLRVIDNPLSFMLQVNPEHEHVLDETSHDKLNLNSASSIDNMSVTKTKENNKIIKLVKPITIAKTNNFYHLTSSGVLKPISMSAEKQKTKTSLLLKKRLSLDLEAVNNSPSVCRHLTSPSIENVEEKRKLPTNRPIAEIAPQVKISEESRESNNTQQNTSKRKLEGGMFVLRPEEINSRSLKNKICITQPPIVNSDAMPTVADNEIDMDIESFLARSIQCVAPTNDVYVISDDEDYCNIDTSAKKYWTDVWIICKNILSIGWIPGRQDAQKLLSFEFPGFKYTEFYPEEEAFSKINQVLARKIYVPEHVNLGWSVVATKEDFEKLNLNKLKQEHLNSDYVLTKKGLLHKFSLRERLNKKIKTDSNDLSWQNCFMNTEKANEDDMNLERTKSNIRDLEAESNSLLEEGFQLMSETVLKKEAISDSIFIMSNDQRQKISDRLRTIISSSNST